MSRKRSGRARSGEARSKQPEPIHDRRLMERQIAQVHQLLNSREFDSVEEANAYLQEALASGDLAATPPSTPLEEAQELVYQALEATGKRRVRLARQALEISPDCADAYVILAEESRDPKEARDLYEQGVRAGERALGPEFFERDVGHFWGILETRPYMRARQGLAEVLWYLGERQQAIEHAQDMLRLNPGDNQGIRYTLANWLLAEGRDDEIWQLLEQYEDDASATWAYTRALATFRREGAGQKADQALKEAFEVNAFVPMYMLGAMEMPDSPPELIQMGGETEAQEYLAGGSETWLNTPGAIEWFVNVLQQIIPREGGGPSL